MGEHRLRLEAQGDHDHRADTDEAMTQLQCARVDNYPRRRTSDPSLPNITEGSTTVACIRCRAQVWISPVGKRAVLAHKAEPVCDECRPAQPVFITAADFS